MNYSGIGKVYKVYGVKLVVGILNLVISDGIGNIN